MPEYERAPQLFSSTLQLFFTKHKNFPPTTQRRIMPEDGISPLPSFSLEDSEEADGASVVVRFWPSSRSRTCPDTWRFRFSASGSNSLISLKWAKEKSLGPRHEPTSHQTSLTHPDSLLNRSCMILRDVNNQYKNPFLSVRRPILEPPKTPTRKPSRARYSCATYSWIAWSPQFTDPTTLSDHPTL